MRNIPSSMRETARPCGRLGVKPVQNLSHSIADRSLRQNSRESILLRMEWEKFSIEVDAWAGALQACRWANRAACILRTAS
jgi:hypothetical protein